MQINTHTKITRSAIALMLGMAVLLSTPAILGFWEDHEARSEWEKRQLATLPQWNGLQAISEYFAGLSNFINDHVGLALIANEAYRESVFYIFKDSSAVNVTVGENGFVYLNSNSANNPLALLKGFCSSEVKPNLLDLRRRQINQIYKHYTDKGYRVSFAVAPSKLSLYPENLGSKIPTSLREKCLANGNLSEVLLPLHQEGKIFFPFEKMKSESNSPSYYPKENFHWRGKSAHSFAKEFLGNLDIEIGSAFSTGEHYVTGPADLKILGFIRPITYGEYPYSQYNIVRKRENSWVTPYYKNATDTSVYLAKNPMTERTALIISNSFGAYAAPHFSPAFRTLHHVNTNGLSDGELDNFYNNFIDDIAPTDLIFLLHDSALLNGYMLSRVTQGIKG